MSQTDEDGLDRIPSAVAATEAVLAHLTADVA